MKIIFYQKPQRFAMIFWASRPGRPLPVTFEGAPIRPLAAELKNGSARRENLPCIWFGFGLVFGCKL